MKNRISINNIEEAARIIDPIFLNTPQYEVAAINKMFDNSILFKIETLNPIRSFKGRGTSYYASKLKKDDTIVVASAGNLGQALAYVCQKNGMNAIVFAAKNANEFKIKQMRLLNADVRLVGKDFDEAKEVAAEFAKKNNYQLLVDSLDVETCEGAGTIAKELIAEHQNIDTVLVALGNGAMLTGIGTYFKEYSPQTKVIGVAAKGAPAMADSFLQKKVIEYPSYSTIADGIAGRTCFKECLADMELVVDDVIKVSDETMIEAMKIIHEKLGLVVEASGAICLGAILDNPEHYKHKKVAVIVCGSNLNPEQINTYLL
ncbi:pyridoxal-phosphate dependent enzyme [Erysipelotrichaceae bacterium OttesenSCG-928-M19]|nr:pyridoxal-phosphate dependent enzyme [Erysipelotrichaceae bacterium OttesenSCG-928-M19]